jgi:hypothetical protein
MRKAVLRAVATREVKDPSPAFVDRLAGIKRLVDFNHFLFS